MSVRATRNQVYYIFLAVYSTPSLMFLNSFFHLIFCRSRTRSYRVLSSYSNVLISMTLFRKKILPRYKAPNDFLFNIIKTQQLTSGGSDCALNNGPKLVVEQPNRSSSGFCSRVLTVPYLCQWHALTCELYTYHSCLVFQEDSGEIEKILNNDFKNICNLFVHNNLSIHLGEYKTKSILFSSQHKIKNIRRLTAFTDM